MTPPEAILFATQALGKVRDEVLRDYEANLKRLDVNEGEISERVAAYRRQMDGWFQRSVDGIKKRFPIH